MTTQKGAPVLLDWAKARLDEMNATLSSLEAEVGKLQSVARKQAQGAIAEMLKQRDAFSDAIKKQRGATEGAWAKAKAALESDWKAFETSVQQYFDAAREQSGQPMAVFRAVADAQRKAWQHAIDELGKTAAGLATGQKAQAESAMKRMKADAEAAKAKLDTLSRAGTESWSAYKAALAATRAAFDRANQAVQDAFKRAA